MSRPTTRRLGKREKQVTKPQVMAAALTGTPDSTEPPGGPAVVANDLLVGAAAIAEFLFGSADQRRRVYWWIEHGDLPVFKLGATICARKSTLARDLTQREARVAELAAGEA